MWSPWPWASLVHRLCSLPLSCRHPTPGVGHLVPALPSVGHPMPVRHQSASAPTFPETEAHSCSPEGCSQHTHDNPVKGPLEGSSELFQELASVPGSHPEKGLPWADPQLPASRLESGVWGPAARSSPSLREPRKNCRMCSLLAPSQPKLLRPSILLLPQNKVGHQSVSEPLTQGSLSFSPPAPDWVHRVLLGSVMSRPRLAEDGGHCSVRQAACCGL